MHSPQRGDGFVEVWLLFERKVVVSGSVEIFTPHFVNTAKIEVRKRVGFIARRKQRAFEPADASIGIPLG